MSIVRWSKPDPLAKETSSLDEKPKKGAGNKCAVGVYPGIRQFEQGGPVAGVFGMVGVFPECDEPVTARCQLYLKGQLLPYYWYACDNPEHRRNAGVIEHLDEKGRVMRTTRLLNGKWKEDLPKLPPQK